MAVHQGVYFFNNAYAKLISSFLNYELVNNKKLWQSKGGLFHKHYLCCARQFTPNAKLVSSFLINKSLVWSVNSYVPKFSPL